MKCLAVGRLYRPTLIQTVRHVQDPGYMAPSEQASEIGHKRYQTDREKRSTELISDYYGRQKHSSKYMQQMDPFVGN